MLITFKKKIEKTKKREHIADITINLKFITLPKEVLPQYDNAIEIDWKDIIDIAKKSFFEWKIMLTTKDNGIIDISPQEVEFDYYIGKSFFDFNLLYSKIRQKKGWEKKINNSGVSREEKIFTLSSSSEKEIQESNSRILMIGGIAIFILVILFLIDFFGWT